MPLIFRGAGPWGAGKGSNLTAEEVDGNFHDLNSRVTEIEENPPVPNNISNIEVVGTQMTIHLEGGASFGPFTLPQAQFRPSVVRDEEAATDGTYAPVLGDSNFYLRFAAACSIVLPSNAAVAFPLNTELTFRQVGSGVLTFTAGSGASVTGMAGFVNSTGGQGSTVTAKKVSTNGWELTGRLAVDEVTA